MVKHEMLCYLDYLGLPIASITKEGFENATSQGRKA